MARLGGVLGHQDIAALAPNLDTRRGVLRAGHECTAVGRSVPVDLVAAHKCLNGRRRQGLRAAVARRAELSAEMTRDEIAAAQRDARLFLTGR